MATDLWVLVVFLLSYLGIALGGLPGLRVDRTGVALLGAVAMLVGGAITLDRAVAALDVPTLLLLYALMVFSAQLRLGGFYTRVALALVGWIAAPSRFLAGLMAAAALLSALLANDIVCLAFTPVVTAACLAARKTPLPHLLGLAIASNIGSAATLIGNPQNMLLGQVGHLDFAGFLRWNLPPALASLVAAYAILCLLHRREFGARPAGGVAVSGDWPEFNAWQSGKGLVLLAVLVALFFTDFSRELSAIGLASLLLLSRRMHSREVLALIDWHLLTLFAALFVLVAAFTQAGWPAAFTGWAASAGLEMTSGGGLLAISVLLSNLVSNVPACMLLLPMLDPGDTESWYLLAAASTYAGNLLLIGSIANLIVAAQAKAYGVEIGLWDHARAGVPVTLASLLILALWVLPVGI